MGVHFNGHGGEEEVGVGSCYGKGLERESFRERKKGERELPTAPSSVEQLDSSIVGQSASSVTPTSSIASLPQNRCRSKGVVVGDLVAVVKGLESVVEAAVVIEEDPLSLV